MASRADNIASNLSLANFSKATELKQRIWFTIGALIVFRFLSFVPLPGVNPLILQNLYDQTRGGILDLFNTFSGGGLERMSLIALGVMPYITSSIVVQLAASLHPSLMALKKEGEAGRKKLNQYTRYGTVFLCAIQGWFLASGLEAYGAQSGLQAVVDPGLTFRIVAVINLIGGTMFLLWLGEQITSRGIGNGVSLIIMAGILAQLPRSFAQMFTQVREGSMGGGTIFAVIGGAVVIIAFISFMERAQRRVLVQYPKRATQRGGLLTQGSILALTSRGELAAVQRGKWVLDTILGQPPPRPPADLLDHLPRRRVDDAGHELQLRLSQPPHGRRRRDRLLAGDRLRQPRPGDPRRSPEYELRRKSDRTERDPLR